MARRAQRRQAGDEGSGSVHPRRYRSLAAAICWFGGGLVAGAAVVLALLYETLTSSRPAVQPDVRLFKTQLYHLLSRTVRFGDWWGEASGGAIEAMDDDLLVISPWGGLALVDPQGRTTFVDGRVPMNLDAARAASRKTPMRLDRFRVGGALLMRRSANRWELFVAHHRFMDECFRFGLSAAMVERHGEAASVSSWRTLFDLDPCFAPEQTIGGHQAGGKMLADGQQHLLVAFGDHDPPPSRRGLHPSQAPDTLFGKLVRVEASSGATEVLASGLRAPSGLARDRQGNLWEVEHGPLGGDELNLMTPGGNYGWPYVTYGVGYDSTAWVEDVAESSRHEGFVKPVFSWVPSMTVSAIAVNDEGAFPLWRDDLLIGVFRSSLYRLRRDGTTVRYLERIRLNDRVRDIAQMNDGRIAVLTDYQPDASPEANQRPRVRFLSRFNYPYCDSDSRHKRHVYASGCDAWLGEEATHPEAKIGKADPATGAELYETHCRACHRLEARQHGDGPHLAGLMGRPVASATGYKFSTVLGLLDDIVWSPSTLAWFLANPDEFAPGTSMPAQNIGEAEIAAIVDYIRQETGGARN